MPRLRHWREKFIYLLLEADPSIVVLIIGSTSAAAGLWLLDPRYNTLEVSAAYLYMRWLPESAWGWILLFAGVAKWVVCLDHETLIRRDGRRWIPVALNLLMAFIFSVVWASIVAIRPGSFAAVMYLIPTVLPAYWSAARRYMQRRAALREVYSRPVGV